MDREQIIYDIERCTCHVPDACRDCSNYTGTIGFECMENLMKDALALLKEQEPVCVKEDRINKCVCGNIVNRYYHPKFCGCCGKELIWY